MPSAEAMRGGAAKAFQANSKSRINELVDSKLTHAPTSAKGVPNNVKAEGATRAAPRPAQARGAANAPGLARQTMEAVGNKGGKVDRKA